MNRLVLWAIAGVLLVAMTGGVIATAEQRTGPVFIAGDQPVTETQVLEKMQSEGWTNVQIAREGKFLQVIGSKDGQSTRIVVDSQTGRLAGDDDDDD